MKQKKRQKLLTDVASFAEQYLIGRKLLPFQHELMQRIENGQRVVLARPGRGNARIHTLDGRFIVSKPLPRPKRRKLQIFTDEANRWPINQKPDTIQSPN